MASRIDTNIHEGACTLLAMNKNAYGEKLELGSAPEESVFSLLFAGQAQDTRTSLSSKRKLDLGESPASRDAKRRRLNRPKGSSVRFQLANTHQSSAPQEPQVSAQIHVYDKVESEEAIHVWWSQREIAHIHRRERSMVSVLTCCCVSYVQKLDELVEMSMSPPGADVINEAVPVWIANSPARGLEPQVMQFLGGRTHSTKRVIRKVLAIQKKLNEHDELISSIGIPTEVLKAQSERLSRRKLRIAQLLAIGDAKVVALASGEGAPESHAEEHK